jgi:hypothetical protein
MIDGEKISRTVLIVANCLPAKEASKVMGKMPIAVVQK